MASTAFVVGFFTALGWWSANTVVKHMTEPVKTEQVTKEKEQ